MGCNILSSRVMMVSILTFCLLVPPPTETGVLTSPTITVNCCISPSTLCVLFHAFEVLLLDACTFNTVMSTRRTDPSHIT